MSLKNFQIIAAFVLLSKAMAYDGNSFEDIRMLGRANTGVASVSDGRAIFYNPAALGETTAFSFTPFNPALGANQNIVTSAQEVLSLTSGGASLLDQFAPFLGSPLGLRGSFFPYISMPGFAVGLYDMVDIDIQYRDPVYPQLNLEARNDFGYAIGYGKKIFPGFFWGFSIRYVKREYLGETLAVDSMANLTTAYLASAKKKGTGYGLNTGLKYRYDVNRMSNLALGVAVEDLGYTTFRSALNVNPPPKQPQKLNLGAAYTFETSVLSTVVAIDYRDYFRTMSKAKKIFMGVDVDVPFVSARAGFYQGYWTAGFTFKGIPFVDLDMSTFEEELDSYAGIRGNRVWMLGIKTSVDFDGSNTNKGSGRGRKQRFRLEDI